MAKSNPSTKKNNPWRFAFPNTADFNFNYYKLLQDARNTAVARAPQQESSPRIAIIGAGVAGLTTARELFRSGYQNIDIYEATNRIGGRTYSVPSPDGVTTFELGAMRLPFFWPYTNDLKPTGKGRGSRNCVLDYYCEEFGLRVQAFPSPGAQGITTGTYINRGRGAIPYFYPDPKCVPKPTLITWESSRDEPFPDDPNLQRIQESWRKFMTMFQTECKKRYLGDKWPIFWDNVVKTYGGLNFRELVLLPAKARYNRRKPGDFGGLGLNAHEARVFAVVGMGDGGWGAFYDVSSLYVLRVCLFGFYDGLQLIQGILEESKYPLTAGHDLKDSLGQTLQTPGFLGVQSFAECLLYQPPKGGAQKSLYEAITEASKRRDRRNGVHLYTRAPVRSVTRLNSDPSHKSQLQVVSDKANGVYDAVVVTTPPWAFEVDAGFENFSPCQLPWTVRNAMDSSHFITSCKVFYPLKERYWEAPHKIPQVIVTDTFIQGVYGIAVNSKDQGGDNGCPGVLLVSYTWEDDATKLVAENDFTLGQRCLDHLDAILMRCGIEKISPYVNRIETKVHHWELSLSYRGCARLSRPHSSTWDEALLSYNQEYSAKSGLYLAGEAYSVEGGWVEPALRSALDAVIHVVVNTEGSFLNGFDKSKHYPTRRLAGELASVN